MFHWICPECGREIAPTVRECPACDGAEQAELVLAGVVEASARTLAAESSESRTSAEAPALQTSSAQTSLEAVGLTAFRDAATEAVVAVDGAASVAHELQKVDSGKLQLLPPVVEFRGGAAGLQAQDLQARLEAAAKVIAEAPQNPPIPEPERLLIPEIVDPATEMSRRVQARTAELFGARSRESQQAFRSIRTKTVESRAVDARSIDSKPIDSKPIDSKPMDAQPIHARTIPATPVNAAPVETKPLETKIIETKTVETKLVASKESGAAPRLGRLSRMLLAAGVDLHSQRGERPAAPAASSPVGPTAPTEDEVVAVPPVPQDRGTSEEVDAPEAATKAEAPTEEQNPLTPESASLSTSQPESSSESPSESVPESGPETLPESVPESLPTSSASLRALNTAIVVSRVEAQKETEPRATSETLVPAENAEAPPPASSSLEALATNEPVAEVRAAQENSHAAEIAAAAAEPSVEPNVVEPTVAVPAASVSISPEPAAASAAGLNLAQAHASMPDANMPDAIMPDPPLGGKLSLPETRAANATLALAGPPPQNLLVAPETDHRGLPQGLVENALATQKPMKEPALVQVQMRLAMPQAPSAALRPSESMEKEAAAAPTPVAASTPNAPQAPGTPARQPGPRMARLIRYSTIAKRMMVQAPPKGNQAATSAEFGVTVPGPVLTEALLRFKDPELKPKFIEQEALKKPFKFGLLILVILIGAGLGFLLVNVTHFFQGPEAETDAAAATAPEAKPAAAAAVSTSNSLSKSIEVTGFRIVMNPEGKMEVQYIVVNHSPVRFPDAKVFVTLYSTEARAGQPPVCQFTFKAPNLGPFEAKEMASSLESTKSANLPDWSSLRASVTIGK